MRLATRTVDVLAEPDLVVFPAMQLTAYVVIPLELVTTVKVAAPSLATIAEMVGAPGTEMTGGAGVMTEDCEAPLPPPPPPQLVNKTAAKRAIGDLHKKRFFNDSHPTRRFSAQCMCATASTPKR